MRFAYLISQPSTSHLFNHRPTLWWYRRSIGREPEAWAGPLPLLEEGDRVHLPDTPDYEAAFEPPQLARAGRGL